VLLKICFQACDFNSLVLFLSMNPKNVWSLDNIDSTRSMKLMVTPSTMLNLDKYMNHIDIPSKKIRSEDLKL